MNATTLTPAMAGSKATHLPQGTPVSRTNRATTFVAEYGLLIALLLVVSATAFASSEGTEFELIYTTIRGWFEGTLGKVLAVSAFGVGMGVGIVKQSLMALAIGIGFAAALAYAPKIIDTIFTFAI